MRSLSKKADILEQNNVIAHFSKMSLNWNVIISNFQILKVKSNITIFCCIFIVFKVINLTILFLDQKNILVFSSKIIENNNLLPLSHLLRLEVLKNLQNLHYERGREGHYGKWQYSLISQWAFLKNSIKKEN